MPILERWDEPEYVSVKLLVLRSDPMPEHGMPEPVITRVELHDLGGRTRMELIDGLYPEGFGHAEMGWNSSFDRLAAQLQG